MGNPFALHFIKCNQFVSILRRALFEVGRRQSCCFFEDAIKNSAVVESRLKSKAVNGNIRGIGVRKDMYSLFYPEFVDVCLEIFPRATVDGF
jgi:hypothetical protein